MQMKSSSQDQTGKASLPTSIAILSPRAVCVSKEKEDQDQKNHHLKEGETSVPITSNLGRTTPTASLKFVRK